MEVIKLISTRLGNILGSYFNSDMDVMSDEAKRIFSNKEDRQQYINAVEELQRSPEKKEKTIKLSNNEEITLVS